MSKMPMVYFIDRCCRIQVKNLSIAKNVNSIEYRKEPTTVALFKNYVIHLQGCNGDRQMGDAENKLKPAHKW